MSERWPRTFLVKFFFGFFFRWKRKSELFSIFLCLSLSRSAYFYEDEDAPDEERVQVVDVLACWCDGSRLVFYFFGVLRGRGG